MNYVRTSSGGMMPVANKSNTLIVDKKQPNEVKATRKSKKRALAGSK
jgi:hypothetical protein